MAELDPDPFWVENRTSLLVWETPLKKKKKWEYRPETLTNRLAQLDREGTKSPFFRELRALREEYPQN